jgi:hypothetical protein
MAFLASLAAPLISGLLGKVFNFKEGGVVPGKKKGKAVLSVVHVGERVLTPMQNKEYEKMMKESKSKKPASRKKKPMK